MASGPSLTSEDIEAVRLSGLPVIVVNSTWEKVRFCKALYAGDSAWWIKNKSLIDVDCEKWICSSPTAASLKLKYRRNPFGKRFNSGANAVELAANHYCADRVLMLGFDCSVENGIHHHDDHVGLNNPNQKRCEIWREHFLRLPKLCKKTELINCSRFTRIDSIKKGALEDYLES